MEDKNIFTWIGENQLKTSFREWWATTHPAETVPSYRTIQRAENRENDGKVFTKPQRRAERRANEFKQWWLKNIKNQPEPLAA